MFPTEELVLYILSEILKNAQSEIAKDIRTKNSETLGFYEAAIKWKSMVGNRRPWDHKAYIQRTYGTWSIDRLTRTQYNYDIWSNLHYGYVGKSVGFSEWTLKSGAGYGKNMD